MYGNFLPTDLNEHEHQRFWSKVDKSLGPNGCWIWRGSTTKGYGQFYIRGKLALAHRLAYVSTKGRQIEYVLDHLCRNPSCVNPSHLEDVSMRENVLRGNAPESTRKINSSKTECPQGHPYSRENTYVTPSGARACRKCRYVRMMIWKHRNKKEAK